MFQFGGFPTYTYVFSIRPMALHHSGFPIRKSAGRYLFAVHRSLSQLVTSFFGSWCQGIHPVLFIAWTSPICSVRLLELSSIIVWIVLQLHNEFSIVCFPPFLWWNCSFPNFTEKPVSLFHSFAYLRSELYSSLHICWLSVRFTLLLSFI